MYFRIETNEIVHSRVVKQFADEIGAVGGLSRFLM